MYTRKAKRQWKETVSRYNAFAVTELKFTNDFCKCFQLTQDDRGRLSELLAGTSDWYDKVHWDNEDQSEEEGDVDDNKDYSECELKSRPFATFSTPTKISQKHVRLLLHTAEKITFKKGEGAMLQWLAQKKSSALAVGSHLPSPVFAEDVCPKIDEIMKASEVWYTPRPSLHYRFYKHGCNLLMQIIKSFAQDQLSKSTIGEEVVDGETNREVFDSAQGIGHDLANLVLRTHEHSGGVPPESERLATATIRQIFQDTGIDLTFHKKYLNSMVKNMLCEVKAHYERELSQMARAGHLPVQTPQPEERDNILSELTLQVSHVFSGEKGGLGNHKAFVSKLFKKNFGSLLFTGTHNSFDFWLGSAFELTDMILSPLLPTQVHFGFPVGSQSIEATHRDPCDPLAMYMNLCLTSRRMREITQNIVRKRVELQVTLTQPRTELAIGAALKEMHCFPNFVHGVTSRTNLSETISHLSLSLDMWPGLKLSERKVYHQHISALLGRMPGLQKITLRLPWNLQSLAFAPHGHPEPWLIDILASIPIGLTFEFKLVDPCSWGNQADQPVLLLTSDSLVIDDSEDDEETWHRKSFPEFRSARVFRVFAHVATLLYLRDPSISHLKQANVASEIYKTKAFDHNRTGINYEGFYKMMSQRLRDQGDIDAADWFDGIKRKALPARTNSVTD